MSEVSILVNCYNSSNTIIKTIESILQQTFSDFEIIIFDNCSNDNTIELINNFKDPRIKVVINNEHCSLGEAREKALKYCLSDFISIIDSDDIAHKDKILKQYNLLKNSNNHLCYTDSYIFSEKRSSIYKTASPERLAKLLITQNPIIHSTVMFKKELLKRSFFYQKNYRNFQDYNNYIYMIKNNFNFVKINEPLMHYYKSSKSTSRFKKNSKKNTIEYLNLLNKANRHLNTNNLKINKQKKKYVLFMYLFNKDKKKYLLLLTKTLFLNFFFINLFIYQKK